MLLGHRIISLIDLHSYNYYGYVHMTLPLSFAHLMCLIKMTDVDYFQHWNVSKSFTSSPNMCYPSFDYLKKTTTVHLSFPPSPHSKKVLGLNLPTSWGFSVQRIHVVLTSAWLLVTSHYLRSCRLTVWTDCESVCQSCDKLLICPVCWIGSGPLQP